MSRSFPHDGSPVAPLTPSTASGTAAPDHEPSVVPAPESAVLPAPEPAVLPAPRAVRHRGTDVALVATFAAFVAACALVPAIPTGSGVPITLQTFGVVLAGLVLGPLRGFLAVTLYLVVGLAGVPVFAEMTGGLGVLGKPSVGYLLAFPAAAAVAGAFGTVALRLPARRPVPGADTSRLRRVVARSAPAVRIAALVAAGLGASFVTIHPAGVAGLVWRLGLDVPAAVAVDAVYWPGDVVKNVLAALVTLAVLRAYPDVRRR